MELLVATGNAGKLREIRLLLAELPLTLVMLADLPGIEVVAENGTTFAENAALKASGYSRQVGTLTLADDSGLEIRALNGAPGVFSARYLGEAATDHERISAVLAQLEDVRDEERTARFVCAVAIADRSGTIIYETEATCNGRIARASRGSGGFGYDPIFIPDGFEQSFAELPAETKNRLSHRGRALVAASKFLASLTARSTAR
jgi:XTP/dITP diphosphohydrolase